MYSSNARRIPLLSEVLQLAQRATIERRARVEASGGDTQHIHIPLVSCDLKAGTHELLEEVY
jgi:hypothetical protein